ncbi:MAG: phosphohydrolase, partial [Cetobacterium sp.]
MKKIEIFGFSISFKLDKKNKDDAEIYTKEYHLKEKILYLMLILILIPLSSKFSYLSKSNTYSVGDVVVNDIYSPKSTVYNDRHKREGIIQDMVLNSEKEYIYVPEAGKIYLEGLDDFFNQIIALQKEKRRNFDPRVIERIIGRKVPQTTVDSLLKLSHKDLMEKRNKLRNLVEEIYGNGIVQENGVISIKPPLDKKVEELSTLDKSIINIFLTANYIYDEEKTKNAIQEKVSQVGNQLVEIKAGNILAKKGEILTEKKVSMLEAVGVYSYKKNIIMLFANLMYLIIISIIFYPLFANVVNKYILNKNYYRSTFLIIVVTFLIFRFINIDYAYMIPFDMVIFLLSILMNVSYAVLIGLFSLAYLLPLLDYDLLYFTMYILSLVIGGYLVKRVATRAELINVGLKLAVLKFFVFVLISYFLGFEGTVIALKAGELILSGLISGML